MTSRQRPAKEQQKHRRQRRAKPVAAQPANERAGQIGLAELPDAPIRVAGDDSSKAQAARLGDQRLPSAQRRTLATRIGRVQGNHHLQRVITSLKRDEQTRQPAPGDQSAQKPSPWAIQRDPDPDPIIIEYGGQRHTFESRDDLARFLSALGTLTNGLARDLAGRDQYFYSRVTEQAQSLVITINLRVAALALTTSDRAAQRLATSVLRDRDNLLQAVSDTEAREHRHHARAIAQQVQREAARMEQSRQRLLEQMHRAFRANNTDLIEQISGAYGRVGSLINEAATFYDGLRQWDGRSNLNINLYTNFLNRAMSVVNYISGLGDEVPGLASPTSQALGSLTRAYNTASTVTTLLNISPTMYGVFTVHIGPALSFISSCWTRIEDQMRHRNDEWYQLYGAEAVNWEVEPGGRAVHDYLAAVFRASGPAAVPAIPDGVGQFFLDNRAILNAAMRAMGIEEMPTERVLWILWRRIQREQFKEWIFYNRELVWRLIYGMERPFPTERPAAR